MAQPRKVMINHDLAKALMAAGMDHFDSGGIVSSITNAFTPTNGFVAQQAPITTSNYQPAISSAGSNAGAGFGNFNVLQGQQQGLTNQLSAQSRGEGPNPAQAALNANTGANIQNQAALMASQRGASGNPALIARQAGLQGAQIQQNAVGQEAAQQAQQQLSAEQLLAQQQAQEQQANIAEQNANTNLLGTNIGGQNAQNTAAIQDISQANAANANITSANAAAQQKTASGIAGGIGNVLKGIPIIGGLFGAEGGEVPPIASPTLKMPDESENDDQSKDSGNSGLQGVMTLATLLAKGGKVPDHVHAMAKMYHPENFKKGGPVPGKASVKGNSYDNDTVPAMLSPGEAVLPRSVTQSKNAPQKAAEFMKHLQKGKPGDSNSSRDLHKALGRKGGGKISDRVARLEKLCYGGRA